MSQRFRWSAERTKALEDLRNNGRASTRHLAKRWGWTAAKVQRFLAFLDSHSDAVNRYTESVKPVSDNAKPIHRDSVKVASLEKYLLDKKPLEGTGGSYTGDLIDEMNRILAPRFADHPDYKRVQHDQRASEEAGRDLQAAGVDLAWAIQRLRQHAMQFHPEKHGKGKPPGTLKFFLRWLLRDWKSERQSEIPLLTVETPHPLSGVHAYVDPSAHKNLRHPTLLKEAVWGAVLEASEASA